MICLPYDLIAYVVQFLQDDPRTLHICASLSRMWHEVCRPQILQKVTIDVRKHTEDPLKRLESLLDQDPSITLLVREIRVSFLTSGRERGSSCEPWIYDLPRLLFKKLPSVQSLEIVGLGLPGDDFCPDFYQALQRLTSIKRLSLIYCCLLYDVLNSIIISFPNLEDLHIHGQWLAARLHGDDDFDLDRIPPLPRIPALKTFYYHNDDTSGPSTHAFLNWIKPIHSLRSIGIHVDSDAQLKQVAAFLRERGPHLEHLEIRFLSCADYWEWDNDSPVNMGEIARKYLAPNLNTNILSSRHFDPDLRTRRNSRSLRLDATQTPQDSTHPYSEPLRWPFSSVTNRFFASRENIPHGFRRKLRNLCQLRRCAGT